MNPRDQITAEARNKICQFFVEALGEGIGIQTDPIDNIIKSAIEKAYNTGLAHGYEERASYEARLRAEVLVKESTEWFNELQQLRAAQPSANPDKSPSMR